MIEEIRKTLERHKPLGKHDILVPFAIRQYSSREYDGITKKNLRAYKVWLIENYKPKTVNLRLEGNQLLLESIGKELENAVCTGTAESPFWKMSSAKQIMSISKPALSGMTSCSGIL